MAETASPRERFLALLGETRVYAVTDDALETKALLLAVDALAGAGIRLFQFRDKRRPDRERVMIARSLGEMVRSQGGLLIVNDRPDVAIAAGADGVHLGQDDLPVSAGRRMLGDRLVIGASASYLDELPAVVAGQADYVGFGAVFSTDTKADAEYAGLDLLADACRASVLPVVGIGGITAERVPAVIAQGAQGVAVVSALFRAGDPAVAAERLLRAARATPDI